MPVVKGGVWTNIEDEILKASVSKYGLNQWARVSSLLARKTPKQCKARWNEWLDPSIKKIEWSKEEDERLLHLAKLMPTQWRTIAPIVGRTATQCLERYQKLLDEAERREAAAGLTGPDGGETQAPSADDVRKLRPGEVDPDPESKPARPDTIDLDEDEKEMLSEARARLANTQGKKAKRKARERQQEESRRLAALQKRRELKLAGINIKVVTRKKGQMDYNADIPFEKKPAPGFYDTSEEQLRNERQRAAFDPKKQQIQSKRKGEPEDESGDRGKRRKQDKDGPSASVQAAIKAGQMQRIREAEQSLKRRPLVLPAPQVSEGELEEIVKMGMSGERASRAAQQASDNDATRGLVQDYTTLPHASAPIRTPRAPAQDDHIANEIRNIRALTETQSSLLGGENAPLVTSDSASTGFDGIAPRRQVVATPNPLATPLRAAGAGVNGIGMTPGGPVPGQTPLRTPLRDSMSLNRADAAEFLGLPGANTVNDEKLREHSLRHQIRRGLAALPKPKDEEWELELPEDRDEAEAVRALREREGLARLEEDQAERDRRERERREALAELERRRRTAVIQRNLPRPRVVDVAELLADADDSSPEGMVRREMARLVVNDAIKFPLPGVGPKEAVRGLDLLVKGKGRPTAQGQDEIVERMEDEALVEARLLVLMEMGDVKDRVKEDAGKLWGGVDAANEDEALMRMLGCEGMGLEQQVEVMRAAFDVSSLAT